MSDPRGALAEALAGSLTDEQLHTLIDEVLAVKKKMRADFICKHCKRRQIQYGEISDALAVSRAIPDLLNQAYGRPVEATVMAEPIQFIRLTNLEALQEATGSPRRRRKAKAG